MGFPAGKVWATEHDERRDKEGDENREAEEALAHKKSQRGGAGRLSTRYRSQKTAAWHFTCIGMAPMDRRSYQ